MGEEVYLIDANIFLELLLGQERAPECAALLRSLEARDCTVILTAFSFYGMEVVLEQRRSRSAVELLIARCEQSRVVELLNTNLHDEREVFALAISLNLDLDDAHQYWAAKKLNATFVSFDSDFDRTDLRRSTPAEILRQPI